MPLLIPVDIINAACAEIGADPLQSLDDETVGGEAGSSIYETVVDFNLSFAPFSWAIEWRQLSQTTSAAPFTGYDYVYEVPGAFLGEPRFFTDDITDPDRRFTQYVLSAGQVHSSAEELYASVKFRPDPHRWSPAFRKVTISAIAAHMAMALASARNDHDLFHRRAYGTPQQDHRGGEMKAALDANAQATPPRKPGWDNNPLTNAWRSGGSNLW